MQYLQMNPTFSDHCRMRPAPGTRRLLICDLTRLVNFLITFLHHRSQQSTQRDNGVLIGVLPASAAGFPLLTCLLTSGVKQHHPHIS